MEQKLKELTDWLNSIQDEPIEEMDAFFTKRVSGYDEHMLSHWQEDYPLLAEQLPAQANEILDLGCGTGLEMEAIYQRFPNMHITGIDLSESMLAQLQRKFPDKSLTLRLEDYFAADLGETCYDAVVSFESLHHFKPEKKRLLYEKLYRALRPGGVFVLCDYFAWNQEHEDLLMAECERRRRVWQVPEDVYVHFDTPLTPEHEIAILEAAGFLCRYTECKEAGLIVAVKESEERK